MVFRAKGGIQLLRKLKGEAAPGTIDQREEKKRKPRVPNKGKNVFEGQKRSKDNDGVKPRSRFDVQKDHSQGLSSGQQQYLHML